MSRASISAPASSATDSIPPFTVVLLTAGAIMFVSGVVSALTVVSTAVTAAYYVSTFVVLAMLWGAGYATYRKATGSDGRTGSSRARAKSGRGGSSRGRSTGTSEWGAHSRRTIGRYVRRVLEPLANKQRDRL